MDREEDVDESLYTLVLGAVIGQRFLGSFLVVLDDPSIPFHNRIDGRVFLEGDILYDNRGWQRIFLVSLDDPGELGIAFF